MAATTEVTFSPSDVEVNTTPLEPTPYCRPKFMGTPTVYYSTIPESIHQAPTGHGVAGAIYTAYSKHKKIILRPEDFQLTLVVSFGLFVSNNAERFRSLFVDFEGVKDIVILMGSQTPETADWPSVFERVTSTIRANTKDDIVDWATPNFTTTTDNDRVVGQVCLMATMKHYFRTFCVQSCGFPEVTLQGTLEDWQKLSQKIDRIREFGEKAECEELLMWHAILQPIMTKILETYSGVDHCQWWNTAVNYHGGSTAVGYDGWFLAFTPFNDGGQWQLKSFDTILRGGSYGRVHYLSGILTVPITFQLDNGNVSLQAEVGTHRFIEHDSSTIKPTFDVSVMTVPKQPGFFESVQRGWR